MDNNLNKTYITLGGYVEVERYKYLYFLTIFMLYILIICCNCTIVYVIVIHQNLHEPMYIFIAALLLNAVLFSTAIYPKFLIDFMSQRQIISHTLCHFQYFLFYTLGGAEFLLLAAMAYDRYVSIFKPLQYQNLLRKTTICNLLLLAWVLPGCLVAGSTILTANHRLCNFNLEGIFCNNSIYKLLCEISHTLSLLGVIILLSIAFLPFLYIVCTYTRILIMSYKSSKNVRRKAAQTCLPHLLVLINFSLFCAYDVIVVRVESDISKPARLLMTFQVLLYHPLFNPIIYGLKMKEISKHIKRLFDCAVIPPTCVADIRTSSTDTACALVNQKERMEVLQVLLQRSAVDLDNYQKEMLWSLLREFQDCFSCEEDELGCTSLVQHSIDTGEAEPIRQCPRCLPLGRQADQVLEKMQWMGIIEPSESPWASPVVIVPKKGGEWRFCVDYR
ncbi:olfactory receptor 11A1-like [Girardinichthys multiradiatus]|uniref:olfactory receptor 11A1-like n=1 Tax=Girardinichthys multiradiatus TaxID=208333 RepID=UPI001FADAF3E|nr:olfactory receptor 11A1-like [Girardinichthys multiradiatus]